MITSPFMAGVAKVAAVGGLMAVGAGGIYFVSRTNDGTASIQVVAETPTPSSVALSPSDAATQAEPYIVLVDATADGAVGDVQTSASFNAGSSHIVEIEVRGVAAGLSGYSVTLTWDASRMSTTGEEVVDQNGFNALLARTAGSGTLTIEQGNLGPQACPTSAVLFQVTFTGTSAGLATLGFGLNPGSLQPTRIIECGMVSPSAPSSGEPVELTVLDATVAPPTSTPSQATPTDTPCDAPCTAVTPPPVATPELPDTPAGAPTDTPGAY